MIEDFGVDPYEEIRREQKLVTRREAIKAEKLTLKQQLQLPVSKSLVKVCVAILVIFVTVFAAQTFLLGNNYIPSASMENTLQINDRIFTLKPGAQNPQRGDIIVFKDDKNWIESTSKDNDNLVKRVIGIGGDTVSCCDAEGRVTVNGEPIEEPYVLGTTSPFPTQKVPEGSVFALGDNRENSADSRFHVTPDGDQFIANTSIIGKAWVRYWPYDKIGPLD